MTFLRRLLLLAVVLVVPVVVTAIFYVGTVYGLQVTQRTIDPQILKYCAMTEYAAFLFVALLEARNRW
jgi:hypothetical protein